MDAYEFVSDNRLAWHALPPTSEGVWPQALAWELQLQVLPSEHRGRVGSADPSLAAKRRWNTFHQWTGTTTRGLRPEHTEPPFLSRHWDNHTLPSPGPCGLGSWPLPTHGREGI
jgi:hypothetical protein